MTYRTYRCAWLPATWRSLLRLLVVRGNQALINGFEAPTPHGIIKHRICFIKQIQDNSPCVIISHKISPSSRSRGVVKLTLWNRSWGVGRLILALIGRRAGPQ